mmetsp:Transcript_42972/g.97017  ORF Transcript_42972/g.97017 Transcript_42972/m.97017 type:complete len:202 (+) Transcript_42972:131-736(+)
MQEATLASVPGSRHASFSLTLPEDATEDLAAVDPVETVVVQKPPRSLGHTFGRIFAVAPIILSAVPLDCSFAEVLNVFKLLEDHPLAGQVLPTAQTPGLLNVVLVRALHPALAVLLQELAELHHEQVLSPPWVDGLAALPTPEEPVDGVGLPDLRLKHLLPDDAFLALEARNACKAALEVLPTHLPVEECVHISPGRLHIS